MRAIVHLSDIHFGKFDTTCLKPLLAAIRKIDPDIVVISGDLTQRAKIPQFEDAQKLLKTLNRPYFVIPGNHDIRPLYSPIQRLRQPFDRYQEYISDEIEPVFDDREIAIVALNTVRPTTIEGGKISVHQIKEVHRKFNEMPPAACKIVVTHHPLSLPLSHPRRKLAQRARRAIHELAAAGIDMYLSGHYHRSGSGHTAERFKIDGYSALIIQAGTVSTRHRSELQSFNVIKIDLPKVTIETYLWNPRKPRFELKLVKHFERNKKQWKEVK